MIAVSEDMLIDTVDDSDTPIGTVRRQDVFKLQANFRVVHVLVLNSRDEVLVQRLALTRLRHPGYWGSSVAAYLFANESYEMAAERRLSEELGGLHPKVELVGKTAMYDEGCHKFIGVFKTVADGPFHYDRTHIERLEFLPIATIQTLIASGGRSFTPTFLEVFDFYNKASRSKA